MTAPTPRDESPRRPIDRTYPGGDAPQQTKPTRLDEAALGGADAVPDTPGVADHGAHVGEERRRSPRGKNESTLAQASAGKGMTMWLSVAGVIVVLILLAVMFF
ncbi:MAG TPA: hypothetical protein VFU01_01520 [Gemmatimonadaceae bacterium]|nr:hypothetical protein [Gemmatimonadaceae bacterium]